MEERERPEACREEHGYTADRARYIARIKRIEGQVRGIERMIDENQYCIDILTQISAITSALENVGLALLDEHLKHCVAGAVDNGGGDAVDAKVEEAMQAIKRMVKS
ncbi:metal-sensitive transcriptional regulator [Corynebacterium sp. UBA2622]|uniref:metal-sensitive transcriptional regulator n=1 Tax=Corynebacterium sp. UBA2622 TaxID=1946393 RepID=UPI0025BD511D|nr:metal-sensitive transcriptional regulator [Corynebacterium sp. UBA2622]